jgi:hypothetical protein
MRARGPAVGLLVEALLDLSSVHAPSDDWWLGRGRSVRVLPQHLVAIVGADRITSDYQKRLPDNADHARTSLVSGADVSGR